MHIHIQLDWYVSNPTADESDSYLEAANEECDCTLSIQRTAQPHLTFWCVCVCVCVSDIRSLLIAICTFMLITRIPHKSVTRPFFGPTCER